MNELLEYIVINGQEWKRSETSDGRPKYTATIYDPNEGKFDINVVLVSGRTFLTLTHVQDLYWCSEENLEFLEYIKLASI